MIADAIRSQRKKHYYEAVDYKIGSHHRDNDKFRLDPKNLYLGPPMIDTKTFKQAFLAGDKDAVMYTNPNEPKVSFYQSAWKGNQVDGDFRATILDKQWQSFAGAPTIPDPAAMSKCIDFDLTRYFPCIDQTQKKFNSIERDRFRQSQRMFGNSASDFN